VFQSPPNLCGSFTQSSTTVTEDVSYTADDKLVVADVTNNGVTTHYDIPAYVGGVATFGSVAFAEGQNDLVTTESDPAGNATVLPTCTVTIGAAPVVTFTTPTGGAILCPSTAIDPSCVDDIDPSTPGWQGNLAVHVTASGVPVVGSTVTFSDSTSGVTYGGSITDASGNAQFNGVTVPEGVQTLVATTDNVPNAGVGSGSATVTVDTVPPNVPTGLDVEVPTTDPKFRRQVLMHMKWTAPSDGGGGNVGVAGYQIRYAKVPIDASNFNNSAVTTAVAYAGTPSAPNQTDGIDISPLYIENNYYFAVEAVDIAGSVSPILATAASGACTCVGQCCASHFNVTTLSGTSGSGTEGAGFVLDGSGDANGDGFSDVLMGSFNTAHAYLYLGSSTTFSPSAPSVVFTGSSAGFGRNVSFIGDIDKDGREDLAIANRTTGVVYIYKGRATWPATMTDANADYTVTADASYAASLFGGAMSRLGDFNGDGVDDFVIGAPDYNAVTLVGRVVIVLGSATFASVTLPSTTQTIVIDGDPSVSFNAFGTRVLGIGHFYPGAGTTLVVSAPGIVGEPTGTEGRIYAFHGQSGSGGTISLASADAKVVGASAGMRIGAVISDLGVVTSSGLPGVLSGNPNDTTGPGGNGTTYVYTGDTTTGLLNSSKTLNFSGATSLVPFVVIGGGVPGRDFGASLLGSSTPDFVVVPRNGGIFGIVDGSKESALSNPADVRTSADVVLNTPGTFTLPTSGAGSLIPDVNGDGFADFAIGNGSSAVAGQVLVYW
jgi:hypothetical protein